MSNRKLQTDHMSEFVAQAEYYRALLQETDRSAALLRGTERGQSPARGECEGYETAYEEGQRKSAPVTARLRQGQRHELTYPGRRP